MCTRYLFSGKLKYCHRTFRSRAQPPRLHLGYESRFERDHYINENLDESSQSRQSKYFEICVGEMEGVHALKGSIFDGVFMFVSLDTRVTLNCKDHTRICSRPFFPSSLRAHGGDSEILLFLPLKHGHLPRNNCGMAEISAVSEMDESDITAMKETLRTQQQLLQKLYAELDEEREASATATSVALDMILRLQGEKAALKMEASHYKRMAEEKIEHAEKTLVVFEDLMHQKEMEIASLEFQVQAYKYKLLSMERDLTVSEFDFLEDLLEQRIEQDEESDSSDSPSFLGGYFRTLA
ncbi:hypothetical protein L6164_014162 [Bauhinia variegata]|uniref:Uncharacterized protein n=1 Tax=Bauhinia variegata TaxID=167791 RepID=A0ACB9NIG1_BAUVA|nr:hypothetical protein L6164_014162 [Bauhinia variegata]